MLAQVVFEFHQFSVLDPAEGDELDAKRAVENGIV
jgi:hypothetical protein